MRLTPLLDRWTDDPAFAELLAALDRTTAPASGPRWSSPTWPGPSCWPGSPGPAGGWWSSPPPPPPTPRPWPPTSPRSSAPTRPPPSRPGRPCPTSGSRPAPRRWPPACACSTASAPPDRDGLRLLTVPARAMMQPLAPGLDVVDPVRVARGDRVELEELLERLVASGYRRTDMVERRGEVAVRGGLVDFFPPGEDHPVRVELWGDEVESIRAFAVSSQRSLTELPEVEAWPCREVRLGEAERGRARQLAAEVPVAGDLLAQVAEGLDVEGVESLLPLLFDDLQAAARLPPRRRPAGAGRPQAHPRPGRGGPPPGRRGLPGVLGQRRRGRDRAGRGRRLPAPGGRAGGVRPGPAPAGAVRLRAGQRGPDRRPRRSSPTGPTSPGWPPTPAT